MIHQLLMISVVAEAAVFLCSAGLDSSCIDSQVSANSLAEAYLKFATNCHADCSTITIFLSPESSFQLDALGSCPSIMPDLEIK